MTDALAAWLLSVPDQDDAETGVIFEADGRLTVDRGIRDLPFDVATIRLQATAAEPSAWARRSSRSWPNVRMTMQST